MGISRVRSFAPQLSANVQPVHGWQHQVENDKIDRQRLSFSQSLQTIVHDDRFVAFSFEVIG
ncbi:MAG: hypothetical protein KatS3mg105_0311 [Gemmatales bacterium]|nr:MAG: hypothetical protein KatS3mg105_0311 [Gemmatales bacterium]